MNVPEPAPRRAPLPSDSSVAGQRFSGAEPPLVPDYELIRRIGGGSYGDVWLARSTTGVLRAVKIVWRHTFEDARPFEREFEGIQHFERLSREHPSQLALFHVGRNEAAGCFYYVMELADDANAAGEKVGKWESEKDANALRPGSPAIDPETYVPKTLRTLLHPNTQPSTLSSQPTTARLPAARVLEIGLVLTEALSHLHTNGLVHRDVKPSNVIFVNGRPKLADIGLVTDTGDTRSIVGTEGYLAPEGPGTPQADLFALGKVLYEAVTGLDRRQLPQLPPDVRDWPDAKLVFELNEIILKACDSKTRQRYQSAEEMHADLVLLQRGESVKERRVWQARIHSSRRIGLAAAAVILIAAGVAFLWQTIGRHGPSAVPLVNEGGAAGTRSPKAANAYQLGLQGLGRGTIQGFRQALEYFTESIEADPKFVAAHARLFETYLMSEDHGVPFIDGKMEKLNELLATLQNVAPTNEETHAAQAIVHFLNWKWPEAEDEFKQALKVAPNCRMALTYYGYFLTRLCRASDARPLLERARTKDPTSPLIAKFLGHCEFAERHYEKALPFYQFASEREPSYASGHYWAGRVYFAITNYPEALVEMEQYELKQGLTPSWTTDRYKEYREALAQAGPRGYWTNRIEVVEKAPGADTPSLSYAFAMRYARLGDKRQALAWLEKAFAQRGLMEHLLVDEVWDDYRHEPSFKDILKQVGLEPWQR